MAERGFDTAEYTSFRNEESGNVALDGNFSIQARRARSAKRCRAGP